ncbi:hypothetical protein NTGHW29_20020 [Candidatus Nitrotoga sp. HW29]|nr:hypothetical protein NTGHW29_20020 [Candidatus Nitrotoga sp. HW29]
MTASYRVNARKAPGSISKKTITLDNMKINEKCPDGHFIT